MSARAIGIDIGGTKIAAGVVDLASGRVVVASRIPTPVAGGGEAVLAACVDLVRDLDAGADLPIGVAVPELVSPERRIQSAYQFDWRDTDLRSAFPGRGVAIASDVRAAASAESTFGAGVGAASMLYVTVGTGISSAFVIDGKPWSGARGNALVLSSGELATIDSGTGSVVRSVLEEWASGPALVARYERMGGRPGLTTFDLLELASHGDSIAAPLVERAAEALGSAVGQAVNIVDPDLVVIGGGLGLAGGSWWDSIVASARRSIWSDRTRDLPIVPARLGLDAGVIGSALATKGM
ncbi:MAG TPA: ROK family protein [Thermomicrobiales bacterium]|nr:ROK family protein [Thermomicrobiales bacterium]